MAIVSIGFDRGETADSADRFGELRIGDFVEEFRASLADVSLSDYVAQWKRARARIAAGASVGCFVTSAESLAQPDGVVFWWVWYRVGDFLAFQNHVLLMSQIQGPFSLLEPERWILPRQTVNEDGCRISEWQVPLSELVLAVVEE